MTPPTTIGRPGARARARAERLRTQAAKLPEDEASAQADDAGDVTDGRETPAAASTGGGSDRTAVGRGDDPRGAATADGPGLLAPFRREVAPPPAFVAPALPTATPQDLPESFRRPVARARGGGIDPRAVAIALTIASAVLLAPVLFRIARGHADGTGGLTAFLPGHGGAPDRARLWGLAVAAAGPFLLLAPLDAFWTAVVTRWWQRRGVRRANQAELARDRALLAEELAWRAEADGPVAAQGTPPAERPEPAGWDPAHPSRPASANGAAPGHAASGADSPDAAAADGGFFVRDQHPNAAHLGGASGDAPSAARDGASTGEQLGQAAQGAARHSQGHLDATAGARPGADPSGAGTSDAGTKRPRSLKGEALRLADQLEAEADLSVEVARVLDGSSAWYLVHDGACDDIGFPHLVMGPALALVLPAPADGRPDDARADAMAAALERQLGQAPAVVRVGDAPGAVSLDELVDHVEDLPAVLVERAAASRRLVDLTGSSPEDPDVEVMLERVRAARAAATTG